MQAKVGHEGFEIPVTGVKGGDYVEKGLARYEEQVRKTKEYALKRLAKELGRQLVPVPTTT